MIVATFRSYDKITFQGAGKNEQEALNYLWAQYNRYYKTN